MTFRYARHTTDLKRIEKFYTEIVGLQKLGSFEAHEEYDGIFLGIPGLDWHLEFTVSPEKPHSKFDEDDILVFYKDSPAELASMRSIIERHHIPFETPKNPYWSRYGLMISDPDGYKIMFALKHQS
ncbi:VOC family protein [Pseudobacter ginsenosidimutans]|uniref:Glyoxalase/bleomycin resistance protein/dioxygenase superfamily protein n=1 Tax=Pseudobacter ginsenosidimutans TaxID=661488 RepID=A0A4Q7MB59_9BACT|nr:VOC family protein [Pseudobacter ginsenosidimutans]QEC42675.1 VOC family protein [Pseudobacter ginsenosidimutans]RZS65174.1 glyoxalase/bleomycin resistance protein/dioxygenase superfamily protein [Pseudobacter ginsenosidimutans]